MKKNLHPERVECTITCACGNSFKTISNKESHFVETCSKCSPAFTGKDNKVARTGRAEEFRKKYNLKQDK